MQPPSGRVAPRRTLIRTRYRALRDRLGCSMERASTWRVSRAEILRPPLPDPFPLPGLVRVGALVVVLETFSDDCSPFANAAQPRRRARGVGGYGLARPQRAAARR